MTSMYNSIIIPCLSIGDYTVHGHYGEPDRGVGAIQGGQDRPQQHSRARQRPDAGKETHRQAITAQQSRKLSAIAHMHHTYV